MASYKPRRRTSYGTVQKYQNRGPGNSETGGTSYPGVQSFPKYKNRGGPTSYGVVKKRRRRRGTNPPPVM